MSKNVKHLIKIYDEYKKIKGYSDGGDVQPTQKVKPEKSFSDKLNDYFSTTEPIQQQKIDPDKARSFSNSLKAATYSEGGKVEKSHNKANLHKLKESFDSFLKEEGYYDGGPVRGYSEGEEVEPQRVNVGELEGSVMADPKRLTQVEVPEDTDSKLVEEPYDDEELEAETKAKEEKPEETADEDSDDEDDSEPETAIVSKEPSKSEPKKEDERKVASNESPEQLQYTPSAQPQPNDLARAQKERDMNIAGQQIMKGATLFGAGASKTDPSQTLKVIGENDKYVGLPVQKYQEQMQYQGKDPNSPMTKVLENYLQSKGIRLIPGASADDYLKFMPYLAKEDKLKSDMQRAVIQSTTKQDIATKNRDAADTRNVRTTDATKEAAKMRADAVKSGQGKADERQDQRLAGQIVNRIHQDPVIKPSMQNMASLEKSKAILENKDVPLTPQLLSDAEQDIANALTIRGQGGTEGKIKRSELVTMSRKLVELQQKYLNQPDIDLRQEDPDLVKQIYKTNRALYDDYKTTIEDAKDRLAQEYKPMAEKSPRVQKTIDQYLKKTTPGEDEIPVDVDLTKLNPKQLKAYIKAHGG